MSSLVNTCCFLKKYAEPLFVGMMGLRLSLAGLQTMATRGVTIKSIALSVLGIGCTGYSCYSLITGNQISDHSEALVRGVTQYAIKHVVHNLEGIANKESLTIACMHGGSHGVLADCTLVVPQSEIIGSFFGRNESTICKIVEHLSSCFVDVKYENALPHKVAFTFIVK